MQTSTTKSVACDACRLRKVKCTRTTPAQEPQTCEACSRALTTCTFNLPIKRRGPKPRALRSLDQSSKSIDYVESTRNGFEGLASGNTRPIIDRFCSPKICGRLIQDYLERLYPLMPIVHRQSFVSDLKCGRHYQDSVFLGVVLSVCALVVATMPKRYTEYRFEDPSLPYSDYREMVQAAKGLIQEIQQEDYYNTLTLEKWTIAHTVGLAMVQLGFLLEGKKFHAESSMILLELGINRISTYEGLNFIESQMRKKAFWINLSSQSHLRLQQFSRDSLADRFAFEEADAEHLYLLNLDDEVILPDRLQTEAASQTPLIAGLVASSRIHICLSSIIKESIPVLTTWSGPQSSTKRVVGNCECGRMISPVSAVEILNYRLKKVRGILDDLPSELHLVPQPSLEDDEKSQHHQAVRCMQYESMAANIHITALWAQSILLESIIAVSGRSKDTNAHDIPLSFDEVWTQREKICRQLLSTIKRLSSASVEASGMILIYKIRQVAATLMEYPFGEETQISFNAELYSKAFAEHLSELYSSGGFPTQTGGEDEIQRYQTRLGLSENTG